MFGLTIDSSDTLADCSKADEIVDDEITAQRNFRKMPLLS